MEREVMEIIYSVGVPVNCRGFHYMKEAIILMLDRREDIILVTKDVYPHVAKRYNTSSAGVEKAIRSAVCKSWERRISRGVFAEGHSEGLLKKPTNLQFLTLLLEEARSKRKRITK